MPVIAMPIAEILKRLPTEALSQDRLVEILAQLGSDIEDVCDLQRFQCQSCGYIMERTANEGEPTTCDQCYLSFRDHPDQLKTLPPVKVVRMELLAVRPDVFDVGGLSRMLRGYLDLETGLKTYPCLDSDFRTIVGSDVAQADCFRPHIACAVVKGLRFDDYMIKAVMKLQENLHWALGRNRKLASIGVYDLSPLTFPMHYRSTAPAENAFSPLPFAGWDGKPMLPQDILKQHPKGIGFADLLKDFSRYPLLVDANGQVLSMPPIINSAETRVTADTTDIFIDVTGPFPKQVDKTLNVFVTALLEMQPGLELFRVTMQNEQSHTTPKLEPEAMDLSLADCNKLIGFDIDQPAFVHLLEKARYNVRILDKDRVRVTIPAYRADIMHAHDIYEDAAIMYGYHNLNARLLDTLTQGRADPWQQAAQEIRSIMAGLTFLEVRTLPLTNADNAFTRMELPPADDLVHILNPASQEHEMVMHDVLPNLLSLLAINKHNPLPQQIFELSEVSRLREDSETGARDIMRLAALRTDSSVGFSHMRAVLQALFRSLNMDFSLIKRDFPFYIPGRGGVILLRLDGEQVEIGHIGEIHPQVLQNYRLENPVCACELTVHPGMVHPL